MIHAGIPGEYCFAQEAANLFGSVEKSETALIGTFYDLKQTQRREPPADHKEYSDVVEEFLANGWDESVLNRYFRASQALYTTQIFIPRMRADAAPKAYGVEKIVKPSAWVAHYKGQVSAPEDGTYRFVGGADDVLVAAVNGKTVFSYVLWKVKLPVWNQEDKDFSMKGGGWPMIAGNWFEVKKGEPFDLDILIGERPGGEFEAFLLYQKKGAAYSLDNDGKPLLPIFQLAHYDTPAGGQAPKFLKGSEIWKAYQ